MSSKRDLLRASAYISGVFIVVVSLFFISFKLWGSREHLLSLQVTSEVVFSVLLGSLVYALNCFLLSLAWQRLLVQCGQADARFGRCHVVYARTQIAKYIPGNVLHFASRHLVGNSVGFQHLPLAGAALYELAGLLFASGAIAVIGAVCFGFVQQWAMALSSVVAVALLLPVIPLLFQKILPQLAYFQQKGVFSQKKTLIESMRELVPTYCLYFLFFLISGGVLWGLVTTMSEVTGVAQSGWLFATAALSWIAGVITPGAPAGIGVREAAIVIALDSVVGEPRSLLVAVLFRTITVLGDVLFFLSSYLLREHVLVPQPKVR